MEREIKVNDSTMLNNLTRELQIGGQILSAGLLYGTVVLWNEDQPDKPYQGKEHHSWIDYIKWNKNYEHVYIGNGSGYHKFVTSGGDGVSRL